MANPESSPPEGGVADRCNESPEAQSQTKPTCVEQHVFCSAGAMSPEIDRILGSHLQFPGTVVDNDLEEGKFCDPFKLILLLDPTIETLESDAKACGISVHFLRKKLLSSSKPADYYRMLSQLVDLVLYYVQKNRGEQGLASPFALTNQDYNSRALALSSNIGCKPLLVAKLEVLADELHTRLSSG